MLLPSFGVVKVRVAEDQFGPAPGFEKLDGYNGVPNALECAFPVPCITQPLRRTYFKEVARHRNLGAPSGIPHRDAILPAHPQIDLYFCGCPAAWAPPRRQCFRLRPGAEDFFGRRAEPAPEVDVEVGWFDGSLHFSSPLSR